MNFGKFVNALDREELGDMLHEIAVRVNTDAPFTLHNNINATALFNMAELLKTPQVVGLNEDEKNIIRDPAAYAPPYLGNVTSGKIWAIKAFRARMKCGLLEAKKVVDAWCQEAGY